MRSILEQVTIYGATLKSGIKMGFAQLGISAAYTITEPSPYMQSFDLTSTTRVITLPTVTAADNGLEKEILNTSTGAANITLNNAAGTTIATIQPGGICKVRVVAGAWIAAVGYQFGQSQSGAKSTLSLYTTLIGLVNTNILAIKVPFAFTLTGMRFRPRTPATTAAKLATLTAGIASTGTGALSAVTGGVLSLTSANMTPTNTPVDATSITAANTGIAGASVGATVSAVTAFAEGDGYLEFDVTRSDG